MAFYAYKGLPVKRNDIPETKRGVVKNTPQAKVASVQMPDAKKETVKKDSSNTSNEKKK